MLYCPACDQQWVIDNVGNPKRFKQTAFFNGLETYRAYKCICMDIDGINNGEAPFGYGVRVDGKVEISGRGKEWINKSLQKGDK